MEKHDVVFSMFVLLYMLPTVLCFSSNCKIQSDNKRTRETIILPEKSQANLSYELPTIIPEKFILYVRVCKADEDYIACKCRWTSANITVCTNQTDLSTCDAGVSSVTFGLNVTRTHSDVVWEVFEQNSTTAVVKHSELQVLYPPEITEIIVEGEVTNRTHVTNEGQEVQISCLFTNGNPPTRVSLISDTTGQNVSSAQPGEGSLQLSLGTIGCHEVWPSIGCEAPGSELNRSVLILVRCLPQLSCVSSEVDLTTILENDLTFGLKSYTRNIQKCELTRLSPRPVTVKEVSCDIRGSVPDLNLRLRADRESWTGGGTWMLQILSEQGIANITFTLVNNTAHSNITSLDHREPKGNDLLVITACAVSLIVFGLALFLFCIVRAKQRGCAPGPTPERINAEGLIYGELDFSDRTASDVIHGVLPETEYAEINFAAAIRSSSE